MVHLGLGKGGGPQPGVKPPAAEGQGSLGTQSPAANKFLQFLHTIKNTHFTTLFNQKTEKGHAVMQSL